MHDGIMQNIENLGPLYFGLLLVKKKTDPGGEKTYQNNKSFYFFNKLL